jgi:hypothetical protein
MLCGAPFCCLSALVRRRNLLCLVAPASGASGASNSASSLNGEAKTTVCVFHYPYGLVLGAWCFLVSSSPSAFLSRWLVFNCAFRSHCGSPSWGGLLVLRRSGNTHTKPCPEL